MFTSRKVLLSLVLCAGAIAGCASTKPVSYGGLTSANQLAANPQDKDAWDWRSARKLPSLTNGG
jgi:hypothetical protein